MAAKSEVWIGLVGVAPKPGNVLLKNASGAYVNVLAWANNAAKYRSKVRWAVKQVGFKLLSIKEVEPMSKRIVQHHLPVGILRLTAQVKKDRRTSFDVFYTYSKGRNNSQSRTALKRRLKLRS